MKELTTIALVLLALYLLASVFLYLYQRKMIYFPVALDADFQAEEIKIRNQDLNLHGWVLNPGRKKGIIYFGGNSETITANRDWLESIFSEYSIYLINYRGYGKSEGKPSEAGLNSDALAIFDRLAADHESLSAFGRSLGSGPASYLAAQRQLERLILLTPYDSIAEVAQKMYPIFPVKWLIKDRFDSAALADRITIPVLLITAEHDRVIPLAHSLALKQRLMNTVVDYHLIRGAFHNDVVNFSQFQSAVSEFLQEAAVSD